MAFCWNPQFFPKAVGGISTPRGRLRRGLPGLHRLIPNRRILEVVRLRPAKEARGWPDKLLFRLGPLLHGVAVVAGSGDHRIEAVLHDGLGDSLLVGLPRRTLLTAGGGISFPNFHDFDVKVGRFFRLVSDLSLGFCLRELFPIPIPYPYPNP